MKRTHLLILALVCIISTFGTVNEIYSQQRIIIKLNMPPPGELYMDRMWSFTLTNLTGENQKVYLKGTATEEQDGLIATGQTVSITLKPNETKNMKVSDLPETPDINYVAKDGRYKESLIRQGKFPDGKYEICVKVIQSGSNEELGSDCFTQTVEALGSITLLTPKDGDEVDPKTPIIFSWLFAGKPSDTYKLTIVEVQKGQSPETAMNKNRPFYTKDGIKNSPFTYPPTGNKFEEGKKYAWMVESGSISSELQTFIYAKVMTPLLNAFVNESKSYQEINNCPFELKLEHPYSGPTEYYFCLYDITLNPFDCSTTYNVCNTITPDFTHTFVNVPGQNIYTLSIDNTPSTFKLVDGHEYIFIVCAGLNGISGGSSNCVKFKFVGCSQQTDECNYFINPSFEDIDPSQTFTNDHIEINSINASIPNVPGWHSKNLTPDVCKQNNFMGDIPPFHGKNMGGLSFRPSHEYVTEELIGDFTQPLVNGVTYRISARLSTAQQNAIRPYNGSVDVFLYDKSTQQQKWIGWETVYHNNGWQQFFRLFNVPSTGQWDAILLKGYEQPEYTALTYIYLDSFNVCESEVQCSDATSKIVMSDTVCLEDLSSLDFSHCENEQNYYVALQESDFESNEFGTYISEWFANSTAANFDLLSFANSKDFNVECGKWYTLTLAVGNPCTQWYADFKTFYVDCCSSNPCDPSNTLNINTGFNHHTEQLYNAGETDEFWTYGSGQQSSIVTPPIVGWCAPNNSQWINTGNNISGSYQYTFRFCMDQIDNPTLDCFIWADNSLSQVQLNGNNIPINNLSPNKQFLCNNETSITDNDASHFVAGENILTITIFNDEGNTGLKVEGTVTGNGLHVPIPDTCECETPPIGDLCPNPTLIATDVTTCPGNSVQLHAYLVNLLNGPVELPNYNGLSNPPPATFPTTTISGLNGNILVVADGSAADGNSWGRIFDAVFYTFKNTSNNLCIMGNNNVLDPAPVNGILPMSTTGQTLYNGDANIHKYYYLYNFTTPSNITIQNKYDVMPLPFRQGCYGFGTSGNGTPGFYVLRNQHTPHFNFYQICNETNNAIYSWTPIGSAPALTNPNSPEPTFTPGLSPGTFKYNVTATVNGTTYSTVVQVVVTKQCYTVCTD